MQSASPSETGRKPFHILVADDEEQIRAVLRKILTRSGFEVSEAANGNEALRLLKDRSADVVVTDLIMPDKEGIETIKELRQLFPQTKIVAISGGGRLDQSMYLSMAKKIGANRILPKPFLPQELLSVVQELTGTLPPSAPAVAA